MPSYKVLFVGSPGSGKTTAIRALSEVEVVDTDAKVSDATIKRKRTTTVGMDYGKLTLDKDSTLHLYGTPGQERFKFMWDLMVSDLAKDASALILLVDNTRNYPFQDIDYYLSEFWDYLTSRHFIIAVTRSDLSAEPSLKDYQNRLKEKGILAPVVFVDARKPLEVLEMLSTVLSQSMDNINWSELSHRVAMQEFAKRNPDPESPQFEWLRKTRDVPKMSAVDAAMQSRGVLGAVHFDKTHQIQQSNLPPAHSERSFKVLIKLAEALNRKLPAEKQVSSLLVRGHDNPAMSLFLSPDQALGLLTQPSMPHNQIRQQADDLLQWSEHVPNT